MGGCLRGFLLIVGAIVVLGAIGAFLMKRDGPIGMATANVVEEVRDECLNNRAELDDYLQKAANMGIIKSDTKLRVDEAGWAALEHIQKINLTIAAFCQVMKRDGTGSLTLYGLHDNQVKARMFDGNYLD